MNEEGEEESIDNAISGDAGQEYVGFGRPPKRTQFKKGKSGNPSGRPKKKCTPREYFEETFNKPISLKIDGQSRKITATQAIFLQLRARCMKGDPAATRLFFQYCRDMSFMAPSEDNGKLDELVEALRQGPVSPGESNE